MKPKFVGTYLLGGRHVNLFIGNGDGGYFRFAPSKDNHPSIHVDMHRDWTDMVKVLIHEVHEFVMAEMNLRFNCTQDYGNDMAGYLFVMSHCQFSDVCGRVAQFMVDALPDLAKKWKRMRRKK